MAKDAERLVSEANKQPHGSGRTTIAQIRDLFLRLFPTERDQVIQLLRWYGSARWWSSRSSFHESVLQDWLLQYATADSVSALADREPAAVQGLGDEESRAYAQEILQPIINRR